MRYEHVPSPFLTPWPICVSAFRYQSSLEAQVVKVNAGNGIGTRIIRIGQRSVNARLFDGILLIIVSHPSNQTALFGTALECTDKLCNVDITDATENLVEGGAGNSRKDAIRFLDRIVPIHIVHENLRRVGTVDDRTIGQRDITDKAQQVLQEHRIDADDAINVLPILGLPQRGDTLRVAGPIRRIGIARVVQVTVVAEQRLILFVDALDCLILAESNAGTNSPIDIWPSVTEIKPCEPPKPPQARISTLFMAYTR